MADGMLGSGSCPGPSQSMNERWIELSTPTSRAYVYPEHGFQLFGLELVAPGTDGQMVSLIHAPGGSQEPWDRRHGNPVLFPSVGRSYAGEQPDAWSYREQRLQMPLHGWARDLYWHVEQQDQVSVTARLQRTHGLELVYPFEFELRLQYLLTDCSLRLTAELSSQHHEPFPYTLGFHPYLRVPLGPCSSRKDCFVELPQGVGVSSSDAWRTQQRTATDARRLRLDEDLSSSLVLTDSGCSQLCLSDAGAKLKSVVSVAGSPQTLPVWVVWAESTDCAYVCLEPWASTPNALGSERARWISPAERHDYQLTIALQTL